MENYVERVEHIVSLEQEVRKEMHAFVVDYLKRNGSVVVNTGVGVAYKYRFCINNKGEEDFERCSIRDYRYLFSKMSISTIARVCEALKSGVGVERRANEMDKHQLVGFCHAMTAYGGDRYEEFQEYYTEENVEAFEGWMKSQPKVNGMTLYRGYTFEGEYFSYTNIKEGNVIDVDALTQDRFPSFTAQPIRACNYINVFGEVGMDNVVKVLFEVKTRGKYFVDISELSLYKEEKEYKCCNDVRLKVLSVENKGGYTKVLLEE